MAEFIFMAVVTALAISGLAYLFTKKAIEKKQERKWVKCAIAALCAVVSTGFVLSLLYFGIVSQSFDRLMICIIISILSGVVLTWIAIFYVKRIGGKFLLFLAPAPYMIMLFFITMVGALGCDFPLSESEVRYKTQEEIEAVLGVNDLPKLKFSEAADASYGRKVWMKLEDEADSTRLHDVFKKLKAERPLQISDIKYTGDMFMIADNNKDTYVNVAWKDNGLFIIYGNIWGRDGINKQMFDSIQAPFPKYEYITFMAEQCGPDWSHYERIEFDKSVSHDWLEKVKQAARKSEHWYFNKDNECYSFGFDDGRIYMRVKLYKNLHGKRKIADVNWGDY